MATKTISITTKAYEMLSSWKEANDSFSDVIEKLCSKKQMSDYFGILSEKESKELRKEIKLSRKSSNRRTKAIEKELNDI